MGPFVDVSLYGGCDSGRILLTVSLGMPHVSAERGRFDLLSKATAIGVLNHFRSLCTTENMV